MSWRALVWCLCALWCGACGPTPPPNTGGTAPDVGEPCATRGAACQPGLVCNAQGLCDWARCGDAPDPVSWCAGQLGVEAERAVCGADGCAVVLSGAGQPCANDAGCHAGLVCAQRVCVALCVSSASCPGADRACVERAPGSPQSICGPRPACSATPDPVAFCADLLGVEPSRVECGQDGRCQLERYGEGYWCARDRECLDGLVCEGNACTPTCDGMCADPRLDCLPRPSGGQGKLCQYVPRGCAAEPEPQVYCDATRGAGSLCDYDTGECSTPPRVFDRIVIEDRSAPTSCAQRTAEGLLEPGADIVSVEVFDRDGQRVEVALDVELFVESRANNFASPDLNASSQRAAMFGPLDPICPARRAEDGRHELDGMVSLGCGGLVRIRLSAPPGEALPDASLPGSLLTGMKLRIGEYAPVCDGQPGDADPDAYTVTLCEEGMRFCEQVLTPEPVRGTVWFDVP